MPAFGTTMPCADTEADATTTVIAGLRNRLARAETAGHPAVQRELRKTRRAIDQPLDQTGRKPGRHRFPSTATAS